VLDRGEQMQLIFWNNVDLVGIGPEVTRAYNRCRGSEPERTLGILFAYDRVQAEFSQCLSHFEKVLDASSHHTGRGAAENNLWHERLRLVASGVIAVPRGEYGLGVLMCISWNSI
jgi:hypothetical protein